MEMLPLKRGVRVLCMVVTAPHVYWTCVLLAYLLIFYSRKKTIC